MEKESQVLTAILNDWRSGNHEAGARLISIVYDELRRLAGHYLRAERKDHTLQATALVHELYLRLFTSEPVDWQNRGHFFAVAAQQLRRILVDHARRVHAEKRGGDRIKLSLTEIHGVADWRDQDLIAVDDALIELHELDPRASQAVELRFFGGLTEAEAAEVLGISLATLKRDWAFARAWLVSRLTDSHC